jgi:hypothetical protein
MRTFLNAHWKSLVAIVILVLLALFTMSSGSASPDVAARLRAHVAALAPQQHPTAPLERAARYIRTALAGDGYRVASTNGDTGTVAARNIEAALANVAPGARAARVFIVGARLDLSPGADDNGSAAAAVLELAHLLRRVHPSQGTEIRFVFFVDRAAPWPALQPGHPAPGGGNFIAFAGSRASSTSVGLALAAFRAGPDDPADGLATPAFVQGLSFSPSRAYPAFLVADTSFLRYPYFNTAAGGPDLQSAARVLQGLARTLSALAATTKG